MGTEPIRVVLVEDHALVRAGIRALLESIPGIQVLAEAGEGTQALALIDSYRPDVVLMDIALPGINGLELTAQVIAEFPPVRVIILSMYANEEYVAEALRAGATGYLLKNASTPELALAVQAVARGESYLSPPVSLQLVQDYARRARGEPSGIERLTARQREILQLIAAGHTTVQIAQQLHISPKTVESHRNQLMQRLEIYDIPGLVRYAIQVGLLSSIN
jgi:DNA-binding NarL/FixJ family response regulator